MALSTATKTQGVPKAMQNPVRRTLASISTGIPRQQLADPAFWAERGSGSLDYFAKTESTIPRAFLKEGIYRFKRRIWKIMLTMLETSKQLYQRLKKAGQAFLEPPKR